MSIKIVCQNKKAFHDYFIEETYEAGIALTGSEVKSLRLGRCNLKDSYARIMGREVFLLNTHISHYTLSDKTTQPEPERTRKLLLHKKEVEKLTVKIMQKGYTLVPTKVYFKGGKAKVALSLAKGKKLYDKKEALKKKDIAREVSKEIKGRNR